MTQEIHIFIVWDNASEFFNNIIEDLTHHVTIKQVIKVSWSTDLFSENLTRFYGQNLPPGCDKETHVGNAPFHLIIIEDSKPSYAQRDTTKGNLSVNTNIFDLKQKYRLMTGGGHKIHATNNSKESKHDILLLLGKDSNEFSQIDNWDGNIIELKQDLIGANGWQSITDLFNILNSLVTYVVLRNFECLPDAYHMETHGDIDLLVESLEEIIYISNAKKAFPEDYRVHYYININNIVVPFDFRYVGDNYYDVNFQHKILKDRMLATGGFFIPTIENYFYSLLYHALVHKPKFSEDYARRLINLANKIEIKFKGSELHGAGLLASFFYHHDFQFVKPLDLSVHYREVAVSNSSLPTSILPSNILDIVGQATDITVLSSELRQHCTDWPSLYHLSGSRANIMRPFENIIKGDVLEVGAGCGAITRYLGECGANIIALESSPHRAAIARSRTRDLKNVSVLSENFDLFQCDHKFDVITLIGVLEYTNLFTSADTPALAILKKVQSLLKPNGRLIIANENQLGLKYFAGAAKFHFGQPMYGIEGRYSKPSSQSFGRKVLSDMLDQAGFATYKFLVPFPDYKFPISILSEEGLTNKYFDAAAFAWQSVRNDPELPAYCNFSLELAWPEVVKNGLSPYLANSFLVIASVNTEQIADTGVLAYHFSTDRVPAYCKETKFLREDDQHIRVKYRRLGAIYKDAGNELNPLIKFICPDSEQYVLGKPLSLELIAIIAKDGWTFDQIADFVRRYLLIVETYAKSRGISSRLNSPYVELPGEFFDVIPQNIIILNDGSHSIIDKEWQLTKSIEIAHLLFRSLLGLINSISRFGQPTPPEKITRLQFIEGVFASSGLNVKKEDYIRYIKFEADIQHSVTGRAAEHFLNWMEEEQLPMFSLNQVATELKDYNTKLNQDIVERDALITKFNQDIVERDALITKFNQDIVERDALITKFNQDIVERDALITKFNQDIIERDALITRLNQNNTALRLQIQHILESTSWRILAPIRAARRLISRIFRKN